MSAFTVAVTSFQASIPSPSQGVWNLGPLPLRAYALCILLGIVVAVVVAGRRWEVRGGRREDVVDVAIWAVPFGIVGGRIYHVLTDWSAYFGPQGRGFIASLRIWDGGLGIWGAVMLGAVGVLIATRRHGLRYVPFLDALVPAVVLAQAIGRWGNYFNQELFGGPTTLPWGLEIDLVHRPAGYEQYATFHPTFLYESLWCIATFLVLIWADRRFSLGHGRVVWAYIGLYTLGRSFWESLRIDSAAYVGGVRWNLALSIAMSVIGLVIFVWLSITKPGRETDAYLPGRGPASASNSGGVDGISAGTNDANDGGEVGEGGHTADASASSGEPGERNRS